MDTETPDTLTVMCNMWAVSRSVPLLPTTSSPNSYWWNSWSIKCCTSVNKFDRSCFSMTRKNTTIIFSCKKKLEFFSCIAGFTLKGHSNQHRSFSTIHNSWTHYVQLAFLLPANKHPTSYKDVSAVRCQRLQNFVWMFFQQLFKLTSKPPLTTQWQQCGQAVKLKHVVSI